MKYQTSRAINVIGSKMTSEINAMWRTAIKPITYARSSVC